VANTGAEVPDLDAPVADTGAEVPDLDAPVADTGAEVPDLQGAFLTFPRAAPTPNPPRESHPTRARISFRPL
jgi:hypothetical protein